MTSDLLLVADMLLVFILVSLWRLDYLIVETVRRLALPKDPPAA